MLSILNNPNILFLKLPKTYTEYVSILLKKGLVTNDYDKFFSGRSSSVTLYHEKRNVNLS